MTKTSRIECLRPEWPAPAHVRAFSTTRCGGVSEDGWQGLNLATHVGDRPQHVEANRRSLMHSLGLEQAPQWLTQVRGRRVCELPGADGREADASTTIVPGQVCAVLTADCLPVLLSDHQGQRVAAAHAGWRGLAGGVLEASVAGFQRADQVIAWLGPAIGPESFEVGEEVRETFVQQHAEAAPAFVPSRPGHWLADIYALARIRLEAAGVDAVYGGGLCTYSDKKRFYSFRREPITGRMASLIWIQHDNGNDHG